MFVPAPTDAAGHGLLPGQQFEVDVAQVAHGGHMVARVAGVAVFVRHALPGERVRIELTEVKKRYARADAIDILRAHPQRRVPKCVVARPGGCGGCDFAHAEPVLQRELKTQVLREALIRHGGLSDEVVDDLVPDGVLDLGLTDRWRTRMHYRTVVTDHGSAPVLALHKHRSTELIDASSCQIADPAGHKFALALAQQIPVGSSIYMAHGDDEPVVSRASHDLVCHHIQVGERQFTFETELDGFWQIHPHLAQVLVDTALEWGQPRAGEQWWDLFSGVGPLAAGLGAAVGASGYVEAVEASASAVTAGGRALADMPWIRFHNAQVQQWVQAAVRARSRRSDRPVDGVVVDPPRSGMGRDLVRSLAAVAPSRLIVVACDPVALGRDVALLAEHGYMPVRMRAWDAFPDTHHLETMGLFIQTDQIS